MISFIDNNDVSSWGIKSIIETEKIPVAYLKDAGDFKYGSLLLTGRQTDDKDIKNFARIIFAGDIDPETARRIFGVASFSLETSNTIELSPLHTFGEIFSHKNLKGYLPEDKIRLPEATRAIVSGSGDFATLGYFTDGHPAVIKKKGYIWCLFDLGASFFRLITETYNNGGHSPSFLPAVASHPLIQKIYYAFLPGKIRSFFQKNTIKKLNKSIEKKNFVASYPIEIGGFFLTALLRHLLFINNGFFVQLKRWPPKKEAAILFTHDIEPSKFSYLKGLPELIANTKKKGINPAIGLVAVWTKKYFKKIPHSLNYLEIVSHGLYHDGKLCFLDNKTKWQRIKESKEILEQLFKKKVNGYRNPRLDRNHQLWKMLEEAGYQYDSSYPDVDRENTFHFGGGVGTNYPYRPIIESKGRLRFVSLFEYPVTAPDCIMPLFMGKTEEEMFATYRKKLAYIKEVEGLYVSIIHAGVFDRKDIKTRLGLLDFLWESANREGFWIVSPEKLYSWLRQREDILFTFDHAGLILKNISSNSSSGLSLNFFSLDGKQKTIPLPELKGKEMIRYPFEDLHE